MKSPDAIFSPRSIVVDLRALRGEEPVSWLAYFTESSILLPSFEGASALLKQVAAASTRGLRKKLASLQPPAAILCFIPRTKSAGTATTP